MKQAAVFACLVLSAIGAARGQAPAPLEKQATVAWLDKLQDPKGAFAADARSATRPSLPASISAVRALKYFGGMPPRAAQILQYLRSCWNETEGAFAPTPGGKVDVRTTAVALMGLYDLEAAEQNQDMINRGLIFLGEHVKDYEDVRIAAAALEATKKPVPQIQKWRDLLNALPSSSDPQQARQIGGVTVARMRLGESIQDQDTILKTLRAAQQPDGAWDKPGEAPDLESSYRIMRAFFMLKARPDTGALRKFIARCRQPDGGYAVAPGQLASVSGAYYAGVIGHWLDWLEEHGKAP
jgi:prenyltransferase beta subunit